LHRYHIGDIISWVNWEIVYYFGAKEKEMERLTMACAIANKFIREMASRTTLEPVVHL
jgi:hypothetical protein